VFSVVRKNINGVVLQLRNNAKTLVEGAGLGGNRKKGAPQVEEGEGARQAVVGATKRREATCEGKMELQGR
jgi:hypothetical protein